MTKAFEALNGKIPGIVSFGYGVNDSPENLTGIYPCLSSNF